MFSSAEISNPRTRRAFLARAAQAYLGVNLLNQDLLGAGGNDRKIPSRKNPAKKVIYLYMSGGMSHLLRTLDTRVLPQLILIFLTGSQLHFSQPITGQ